MARDQDANAIHSIGACHGPLRGRLANPARQFVVGNRLARGFAAKLAPNLFLERRAADGDRHGKLPAPAGKILSQFAAKLVQKRMGAWDYCTVKELPQSLQVGPQQLPIGKLEKANPFIGRAGKQRTDRAFQHRRDNPLPLDTCPARSLAEDSGERVPEAAVRFKSAFKDRVIELCTVADSGERAGQPMAAAPCGETHAIVLLEPAPSPLRRDPEILQFDGRERFIWRGLDTRHQFRRPGRRSASGFQRPASFAGPVPGGHAVLNRPKEFDVFRPWTRRTGRTTKDARSSHGYVEHAVVAGIFAGKGFLHLAARRQEFSSFIQFHALILSYPSTEKAMLDSIRDSEQNLALFRNQTLASAV